MSISLVSQPNLHQPAYNPIEFVFSSSNSAMCDFVYIADLYVNGTFVIRLKSFKDAADHGIFRVERILQDFLSYDFNPEITSFAANPNSICDYHLEVRERYNPLADCTGQPTLSSVLLTTDTKYSWNAALQYHEYPIYAEGEFDLETSASRFLTSVPNGINLTPEDFFTLKLNQGLSSGLGTSYEIFVQTYDLNNSLINSFTLSNSFYNSSTTEELLLTIPAGPKNIESFVTLTGVNYYTVVIRDSSANNISETKIFYLNSRCSRYKTYRFWWLNRLGGFDALSFDLKSSRNLSITKGSFTKLLPANYSIGDRGETVISVDANTAYTVASNWLTENEAFWLEELFTSPEVYVYETKKQNLIIRITGADCNCPPSTFNITSGAHNLSGGGTAALFIDDSAIGAGNIPVGSFFSYSGTGFTTIGSPNGGGHKQITGYNSGGGFYTTDIVSTISAAASITGTLTLESVDSCSITFTLSDAVMLPIGTTFSYIINDGSALGLPNTGIGTITGYGSGPGTHQTDVLCTTSAGSSITGIMAYELTIITKIPIIISNQSYEEQIKVNVKNIQYTMEFRPSFTKNIQGS